jgi:hypothetical protein
VRRRDYVVGFAECLRNVGNEMLGARKAGLGQVLVFGVVGLVGMSQQNDAAWST